MEYGLQQQAMSMPGMTPTESPPPSFMMNAMEDEDSPLFKEDDFRIWCMKVIPCTKRFVHDWTICPFAHAGEKAVRRDPRTNNYTGIACPDMKKNTSCIRGDRCPYAHNVFEYWLHPTRYRTQLCNDGPTCRRSICFFAHSLEQLRVPACKPYVSPEALARASLEAIHNNPHPLGAQLPNAFSNNGQMSNQQAQQAAQQAAIAAMNGVPPDQARHSIQVQNNQAAAMALMSGNMGQPDTPSYPGQHVPRISEYGSLPRWSDASTYAGGGAGRLSMEQSIHSQRTSTDYYPGSGRQSQDHSYNATINSSELYGNAGRVSGTDNVYSNNSLRSVPENNSMNNNSMQMNAAAMNAVAMMHQVQQQQAALHQQQQQQHISAFAHNASNQGGGGNGNGGGFSNHVRRSPSYADSLGGGTNNSEYGGGIGTQPSDAAQQMYSVPSISSDINSMHGGNGNGGNGGRFSGAGQSLSPQHTNGGGFGNSANGNSLSLPLSRPASENGGNGGVGSGPTSTGTRSPPPPHGNGDGVVETELAQSLASLKIAMTQQNIASSAGTNHEIVISTLHQILKEAVAAQGGTLPAGLLTPEAINSNPAAILLAQNLLGGLNLQQLTNNDQQQQQAGNGGNGGGVHDNNNSNNADTITGRPPRMSGGCGSPVGTRPSVERPGSLDIASNPSLDSEGSGGLINNSANTNVGGGSGGGSNGGGGGVDNGVSVPAAGRMNNGGSCMMQSAFQQE